MSSSATTRDDLAAGKYMALTTFRRTGEPVTSPVWVVPVDDGRVGFWTSMGSGKTKRMAHTARVVVQPSDARGRVTDGSSALQGTAEMVRSGAAFDEVSAKYAEFGPFYIGIKTAPEELFQPKLPAFSEELMSGSLG